MEIYGLSINKGGVKMAEYIYPNIPSSLSINDVITFITLDTDINYILDNEYEVEVLVKGAAGSSSSLSGKGAYIKGKTIIPKNSNIFIRVGSIGGSYRGGNASYIEVDNNLCIMSGAGGHQSHPDKQLKGGNASLTTKGTTGEYSNSSYPPGLAGDNGSDGNSGTGSWASPGGKGYNNNGKGLGSKPPNTSYPPGGAGGGYSGGGGASMADGWGYAAGGGGGSFKSSSVTVVEESVSNTGNGIVQIKLLKIFSSIKASCKIDGAINEVDKMSVKVDGAWKEVDSVYVKVDGNWKKSE